MTGQRGRPAVVIFLFCVLAAGDRRARADNIFTPQLNAQRRVASSYEPAVLQAPTRASGQTVEIVPVRLRIWADEGYRAGLVRWQERIRAQIKQLNQFVAGFGIRFEVVEWRRWERKQGSGDVAKVLMELEATDKGGDVDWVVGLISPLPEISSSMHALGFARLLGRHFVLRGMADVEEAKAIESFHLMDPAEREGLYARRKWHKETALFLHEWLHTLGVPHASEPFRIMHPAYSHQMTGLSGGDAAVALAALTARLQARGVGEPDWSGVARALERQPDPAWYAGERDELIAYARGGARPTLSGGDGPAAGAAGSSTFSQSTEDVDRFNQALELSQAGKLHEARAAARGLWQRHPREVRVARLLCRLGTTSTVAVAGGTTATADSLPACQAARELAPKDPMVSLEAAQVLALHQDLPAALLAADEAMTRAKAGGSSEKREIWPWLAQMYGELGAFTRAYEALAAAGAPSEDKVVKDLATVRAQLQRRRGWVGLGGAFKLPPEREPQYAALVKGAHDLLGAGKRKEARAAVVAGLKRFPQGPGFEALACELAMRDGKGREAEQRCGRAIKTGDVARAHYLLGYLRLQTGRVPSAVASLRRARELDPEEGGPWRALADAYRLSAQRKQLEALRGEHQKQFGKPLP